MKINPYLSLNGTSEQAFTLYAKVMGGKLEILRYGDSPEANKMPPELHQLVMHVSLTTDDFVLMASDSLPSEGYEGIKGSSICLHVNNVPEAERLFAELSVDGKVVMPLQATFWATRFAVFTDQFGVSWLINCVVDSQEG